MSAGTDMPPSAPFRLRTLGTLALGGTEGTAVEADHGQQGRRLALLAALAASGRRGRNRDQLLLFFWPDASQERARHSLEQSLYRIRRSLAPSIFEGVNPLRLNPAVLTSDVEEFEAAIVEGRLESAVELYGGPFLDGFYLSDAPEFEEWMVGERARLETLYAKSLERLAGSAEEKGDREAAVAWWRRLAEVDPLSARPALGLVRSLAAAGDPAGALLHAQRYEALVQAELGTGAGPELTTLVEEIRASAETRPSVRTPGRPPSPPPAMAASEPQRDAARSPRSIPKGTILAALAVAVVAIVFGAIRLGRQSPAPSPDAASIVVLPLTNRSGDPEDARLADGMTEELIAMLARSGDLRVIASTSAFAFRDRPGDVRAIADSLRVSHVLEGGVQRAGARLRVQIRLVDARDGSTRWSETYDREIEDLFGVQEDIASSVAHELGTRLAGSGREARLSRNRARSVAAYELYLRGSDPALLRSDAGVREGLESFRRAVAIDSTYAAAYAGLARMYARLAATKEPGRSVEELHALAIEAARKAVALDDSLGEAHATLGVIVMNVEGDLGTAETELGRAVDLEPSYGRAREWLVQVYIREDRPVDALAEARRALEVDPLSPSAHAELAHALVANGRYDEALVHLGHIADVRPPLLRAAPIATQAYAGKGMWAEAAATLRPAAAAGNGRGMYAYVLARAGRREEALRILETLRAGGEKGTTAASEVAIAYAGLGDLDRAFEWLDRSAETPGGLTDAYATIMEPIFADLRQDPRFERIREHLAPQKR